MHVVEKKLNKTSIKVTVEAFDAIKARQESFRLATGKRLNQEQIVDEWLAAYRAKPKNNSSTAEQNVLNSSLAESLKILRSALAEVLNAVDGVLSNGKTTADLIGEAERQLSRVDSSSNTAGKHR